MIIDADSHIALPDIFDCELGIKHEYIAANQQYFTTIADRANDIEKIYKVNKQLLNYYGPTMGLLYDTPAPLAVTKMKAYNDFMLALADKHDCFDVTVWLAMQDIPASIQELHRVRHRRLFAVHLGEQIPWGFIHECHEIFSLMQTWNIPAYVHFAGHNDIPAGWLDRMPAVYTQFKKIWSNPAQDNQKFLILSLMLEVLPKFPDLRVIVAEHDIDWIAEFCQQVQQAGLPNPLPYLQNNFWFTIECENPEFIPSAQFIGWDRLLFATDAPHYDAGGKNRNHDTDTINDLLNSGQISLENWSMVTELNYKKLSLRI